MRRKLTNDVPILVPQRVELILCLLLVKELEQAEECETGGGTDKEAIAAKF